MNIYLAKKMSAYTVIVGVCTVYIMLVPITPVQ